jgi:glycosyltransferase involved in cell wall biosynthesis
MEATEFNVVTIVKNSQKNILRTLQSVSDQSYPYINHIVIYGESIDNTLNSIQSFPHCKNYKIFYQLGNGIANAFNLGLSHCSESLILFLNSGDYLVDDQVIAMIVASYNEKNWPWAFGETISFSKKGRLKRHIKQRSNWQKDLFRYKNVICHQSTIYSTKLVSKIGLYDESLILGMDYDFNIRASLAANPFRLFFPISYYDTSGLSSTKLFQGFEYYRKVRNKYFNLSYKEALLLNITYLLKTTLRFFMLPIKILL